MTKLYINAALDWLLTDGVDNYLLVDNEPDIGSRPPPDYPLTPVASNCTVSSFSPNYVNITNNLKRYSYSKGAHAWGLELRYGAMTRAQFAPLWAFLVSQAGQLKTFTVQLPAFTIQGTGVGAPRVNGAFQSGSQLETDGWGVSQTVLKKGDWVQVENDPKVYMVMADVVSTGAGLASIQLYPPLRKPQMDNMMIYLNPYFTCGLLSDLMGIDFDQCLKARSLTIQLQELA